MIIQNAVKITCANPQTFLVSSYTHDYKSMELPNGNFVAVDGGNSYIRRSYGEYLKGYEEWNLDSKDDFQEIIDRILWGTLATEGTNSFNFVLLKSLSMEHLRAILRTQKQIKGTIRERVILHLLNQ